MWERKRGLEKKCFGQILTTSILAIRKILSDEKDSYEGR